MSEPLSAYYDNWARKLLDDYVSGNPRAESAIAFAVAALPAGARAVLDVGCGVGWSSHELARHHPPARVRAVDLSPRLIDTARALFGDESRLRFGVHDFTSGDLDGRFDAITLLDVYEHFPLAARPVVHERLSAALEDDGVVVLTVPTPSHQRFLRETHPAGLQPVDEDVGFDELRKLADDLDGQVVDAHTVSVWRPDDYLHAVIRRGSPSAPSSAPIRLEESRGREIRLQRTLGLRRTASGDFLAAREGPSVCVAVWSLGNVSETFIRPHLERLPAYVHVLEGYPPHRTESGRSLLPVPLRLAARVVSRLLGVARAGPHGLEDRLFRALPAGVRARRYAHYLRRHDIRVVLAEFGPVATELHDGCRRAGVPLVPHFHGYDAYQTSIVEAYGDRYRALFADGAPVVAVSKDMKRQLEALGSRADQVHVNHYGIDLQEFRPGEPTQGLVAAVGRLVDKKAPGLALRAFSEAVAHVPDARLVMIGDGPLRPSVESLVEALGLQDRVEIAGARDHEEVAELMRTASVFIQHSVVASDGDREGTPVTVLEAAAAGLPIVATRHEGIADAILDGETGILVDEGDTGAMGAAVAELLRDPARARRLGRAARRRVEELFSIERSVHELWAILERAAEGGYRASAGGGA